MWEIESNSVGNGRPPVSLCPGQVGFVATPPRCIDKTGQVTPTKPRHTGLSGRFRRVSRASRPGMSPRHCCSSGTLGVLLHP
jgi:hypothetical protein